MPIGPPSLVVGGEGNGGNVGVMGVGGAITDDTSNNNNNTTSPTVPNRPPPPPPPRHCIHGRPISITTATNPAANASENATTQGKFLIKIVFELNNWRPPSLSE